MQTSPRLRARQFVWSVALFSVTQAMLGQEVPLAWDQVPNYQYNLLQITQAPPDVDGTRLYTVIFSVTNPSKTLDAPYDLLPPSVAQTFKSPATLRIDFAWNSGVWGTLELLNTKDAPLLPVARSVVNGVVTGTGPASALAVNALTSSKRCSDATAPPGCAQFSNSPVIFWVTAKIPAGATGGVRVGMEGHPSIRTGTDPVTHAAIFASIPVTSVFRDVPVGTSTNFERRKIVEFAKCQGCHDGRRHGDVVVPRLSLHGANRNEEPGVCVMCHNPNQTDAAYRTSGVEESVDFKRLIHGIHAGGMRRNPLIIIGRNGSVNNFSHVRFPAELKNCLKCHIEVNGKGTFELPSTSILGSAIQTQSVLNVLPGQIDVDPENDLRISPIAATCSACHDDSETRRHMVRMGASFGVVQSVLADKEQCLTCHGPGKSRDVRKEHGLKSEERRRHR